MAPSLSFQAIADCEVVKRLYSTSVFNFDPKSWIVYYRLISTLRKDTVEPDDDLNGQVNEIGEKLSDLAGSVQDKTKETFHEVKNKTSNAVEQIKVKYDETADAVAEKASVAVDFAKDKYEDSKEATKDLLASGLQAGISGLDKTLEALESSAWKYSPLSLLICFMLC